MPLTSRMLPQSSRLLFITGMPGAGKTYWGQRVGAALGIRFADLDTLIELVAGMTIREIFETAGEAAFRSMETALLHQLIAAGGPAVVACGGGTPCFNDNLELMKSAGKVVYLRAGIDRLLANLTATGAKRPLLAGGELSVRLETLLLMREPIYLQAHHIVHAEDVSVITFEKILADV